MKDNSIVIIGAGFAGLAAGTYAQMNGYRTEIFEMHHRPGGLCTAWKRHDYTIDGCVHWLVGSSPESGFHRYWEEVGIAQGRGFLYLDEYLRYEGSDGRTLILYTDVNRLENHLLELAPQDAKAVRDFIQGIRAFLGFDMPSPSGSSLRRLGKGLSLGILLATQWRAMQRWMRLSIADFARRFQDPLLQEALSRIWFPEFSMFFLLMTFAALHNKNAGYPLGGSLPLSLALAKRYLDLGGVIHYQSRVEEIVVEEDKAVGIRLSDGSEHHAGRVISAADGYSTIFKMLGGKYLDTHIREVYEKWPTFPALLYVGIGVNRSFHGEPQVILGTSFPLRQKIKIGHTMRDRLSIHIYNYDPTLAPPGKTVVTVMMPDSYEYWKKLGEDRTLYQKEKEWITHTMVELLEERFPGITKQVEVVDVATPLTFERYTGNWKGSFEGWMLTPQNAPWALRRMSQTLPRFRNFYMCGQWVEPGGGLPTGIMSGRRLIRRLCQEDGKKFQVPVMS